MRIMIVYGSTIYNASRFPKQKKKNRVHYCRRMFAERSIKCAHRHWGGGLKTRITSENNTYPLPYWGTEAVTPARARAALTQRRDGSNLHGAGVGGGGNGEGREP